MSVLECRVWTNLISCHFPQILRRILGAPYSCPLVDRLFVGRLVLDLDERCQLTINAL